MVASQAAPSLFTHCNPLLAMTVRPLLVALLLGLVGFPGCDSGGPEPGTVLWKTPAATEALAPTQPLVTGGRVFVTYGEEFGALDTQDGAVLWTTPLYRSSTAGAVLDGDGVVHLNQVDWVKAFAKDDGQTVWTAALDAPRTISRARMVQNATHLFLGRRGEVVRIRKADGVIDLRIDLSDRTPEGVPALAYDVALSPDGTVLYVPIGYYVPDAPETGGYVVAFDAATGAERWTFEPPPQTTASGFAVGTSVYGLAAGAEVVVAPIGLTVYGLDPGSGAVLWDTFFDADGFDVGATLDGDNVYIGSLQGRVFSLDAADGNIQWSGELSGGLSTPLVVRNDLIYLTSPFEGSAWTVDTSNGSVRSRDRPAGDLLLAPIAVEGRTMYSVSSTAVYAIEGPR